MFKAVLPVIFYLLVSCKEINVCPVMRNGVFPFLIIYYMCDTVTYLLALMVMADIQRPSANLIRSIIMLFVNYIEVSFGISYLYYLHCAEDGRIILFYKAIAFSILGIREENGLASGADYIFTFMRAAFVIMTKQLLYFICFVFCDAIMQKGLDVIDFKCI
ncbi:MAG: hypothetical protein K2J99_09075 [Lachnospiraceae bacterium]|nr:hypothetical protein [Lachnospiraceae bacterium]